jgi:hypothetical protein
LEFQACNVIIMLIFMRCVLRIFQIVDVATYVDHMPHCAYMVKMGVVCFWLGFFYDQDPP